MNKKILLSLAAVSVVVAGVALTSAFEAHIINVTAHIENSLTVDTNDIDFGTVFPQEYLEREFTISLSQSFMDAPRVDDVEYKVVSKPKPCPVENGLPIDESCISDADDPDNIPHNPTGWHYPNLCKFLSQIPESEAGDIGRASYFVPGPPAECQIIVYGANPVTGPQGVLSKLAGDTSDTWTVDLKVPPVDGYVGQDWPASCADWVVEENDKTYGCDLWIEVTGFSETLDKKEQACIASGGEVITGMCCKSAGDFPDTCQTGACGCAPENSHEVKKCQCPDGYCFDGNTCVLNVGPD